VPYLFPPTRTAWRVAWYQEGKLVVGLQPKTGRDYDSK
jgi:hypothetical protein